MKRNPFFDNARLLLIFLVVFGHIIQPFVDGSRGMNTLYMWIYTFHMPAFILLAGFFAKGFGNKDYILNLAKKLVVPYILFQLLYSGFYFLIGQEGWQGLFYPHWSLWFLISLFSWHILLYWFKKIPVGLSIMIAIQLGLLVGYFGGIGHSFSISRTFVFFPFFLIGYFITEKQVMGLKSKRVKISSLIMMPALAAAIYYLPTIDTGWLLGSQSYGDLGLTAFGGFARLIFYIIAGLMVISVLAWVPQRNSWFTSIGSRTLYIYLLHGFFIQAFRATDLFEVNHVFDVFGLAAISGVIVFILSSKPLVGIAQPVIEGKASIIKKEYSRKTSKKSA
ncbi:fucose 4-O-acetylase-like acetyltransferase [Virgibacillus natechei]|uniref:Fucose 4-O-acetylase-like acetyltransferase n=1 Tax=Virgibacillus natechei TaxID=1216297 RepID=A0ABS4IFW9_9BACI|nr:acyltransferase family protein [Virgibacillus natechei]MBP1969810.1 fucose 4-O-acetylase-like acetyltransferase [Virgibacillus natechei]UZD12657.1 acyltransferase family protein [Virgibacillus natechei]